MRIVLVLIVWATLAACSFSWPRVHRITVQQGNVVTQEMIDKLMRQMEKLALDENVNSFITLWWYRIIPHRSYVKGWKISPSHYLNQDLSGVWIE